MCDENRTLRDYIIQLQSSLEGSNIERPTEPAALHDSVLQRRQPHPPMPQDPDEEVNALSPSYILQQAAAAAQEASNAATADIAGSMVDVEKGDDDSTS